VAITNGNVLTINSVGYTVSSATAPVQINQITRIAGVVTTTRYVCHVTFTGNVAARTRGRTFHAGALCSYHPTNNFAPGVAPEDGGQGSGGAVRLYDFSCDANRDSVAVHESAGTLLMMGTKSEYNPSAVLINGTAQGGSKCKVTLGGYRITTGGTYESADKPGLDQSAVRCIGTGRSSIILLGGQCDIAYARVIQDLTDYGNSIDNNTGGAGFTYYNQDSTEKAWVSQLQTDSVEVLDSQAQLILGAKGHPTFRARWLTSYDSTNTYTFSIGASGAEQSVISVDGDSDPTKISFKGWSGAAMVDLITFGNSTSLGFFGHTPVARPTGVAVTAAGIHAALVSLGLITA
jgi:hypothetical protein